jgi:hypothetical protein
MQNRAMRHFFLALAILLGGGVIAESALVDEARADEDTWVFVDALKPNGHVRSVAQRRKDMLACGATSRFTVYVSDLNSFESCMNERGWKLDHIVRAKHPAPTASSASDDQDRRNFEQSMDDERRMDEEIRNEDQNLSPGCGVC